MGAGASAAAAAQVTFAAAAGAASGLLCLAVLALLALVLRRRRRKSRYVSADPAPLPLKSGDGDGTNPGDDEPTVPGEPGRWAYAVQVPPAAAAAATKYSTPSPRDRDDSAQAEPRVSGTPRPGLPHLLLSTGGLESRGGAECSGAIAAASATSAAREATSGSWSTAPSTGSQGGMQGDAARAASTGAPPLAPPLRRAPSHPFSPLRLMQEEGGAEEAASDGAGIAHEWGRALDWLLGLSSEGDAEEVTTRRATSSAPPPLPEQHDQRKSSQKRRVRPRQASAGVLEGRCLDKEATSRGSSLDSSSSADDSLGAGGDSGEGAASPSPEGVTEQPSARIAAGLPPTLAGASAAPAPAREEDSDLELIAEVFFSPSAALYEPTPSSGGRLLALKDGPSSSALLRGPSRGGGGFPAAAWVAQSSSPAGTHVTEAWGAAARRRTQSMFDDGGSAPSEPASTVMSRLPPYRATGLPLSPQRQARPELAVFRSASSRTLVSRDGPNAPLPAGLRRGGGSLRSLVPTPLLQRVDAGGAATGPTARGAYSADFISELLEDFDEEGGDGPPVPPPHRPLRQQESPPFS